MYSYRLCASPGMSRRNTGSKNHLVCSEEKVSVDIVKITTDQRIAGHHAHSHTSARGAGVFARISVKLGAGRGLRHGCGSTVKVQLSLILSARFSAFRLAGKTDCDRKKGRSMSLPAKYPNK